MTQQTYGDFPQADEPRLYPDERKSVAPDEPHRQHEEREPRAPILSTLDEMVEDINRTNQKEQLTWSIPDRPNWKAKFNTHISSEEFKSYQRRASGQTNRKSRRAKRGEGEQDPFTFAAIIIQEKSAGLVYKDKELEDRDGQPLTLRSREFLEFMQGTEEGEEIHTNGEAIEEFLGAGFMLQLGDSIAAEAGYAAGGAEPEHPTNGKPSS